MAFAGEPAGEASHAPERVIATRTVSPARAKTLFVEGAVSVTRTENGYSTVVPTSWLREIVLTRGALSASLSASPWRASASAAVAVSAIAAITASVTNGALRRAPMGRLSPRLVEARTRALGASDRVIGGRGDDS